MYACMYIYKTAYQGMDYVCKTYTYIHTWRKITRFWKINSSSYLCWNVFMYSFSSVAQPCPTLCNPMNRSTPGHPSITNSWSPPKPMSIELVMPSNHLILCHPLLLLPPVPPSIKVFSTESALHIRGPKYWSYSFNISPSNEHPGLISFRMDWLDIPAV